MCNCRLSHHCISVFIWLSTDSFFQPGKSDIFFFFQIRLLSVERDLELDGASGKVLKSSFPCVFESVGCVFSVSACSPVRCLSSVMFTMYLRVLYLGLPPLAYSTSKTVRAEFWSVEILAMPIASYKKIADWGQSLHCVLRYFLEWEWWGLSCS